MKRHQTTLMKPEIKLTTREQNLLAGLKGVMKSALFLIPGLREIASGFEEYKRSSFERNLIEVINFIQQKVDDPKVLFSDEWLKSKDGQIFARKVLDSGLDVQLGDKQELFVNVLINGIRNKDLSDLEKLKFVDMLRHLSRASLDVLAEMHKIFKDKVKRKGIKRDSSSVSPGINIDSVIQKLSVHFHPYLIEAAIYELKSVGLFSHITEWNKGPDGKFRHGSYYGGETVAYTDFTFKFVEFITFEYKKRIIKNDNNK